jgi:hypothetical protein
MGPEHSKIIEEALEEAVGRIIEIDHDEWDFLQECVAGIAVHHVMANVECERVDDLTYWEAQTGGFEAGLKVAAALGEGDRVYTAGLDPDEDPVHVSHLFYFVGKDPRKVAKLLTEATAGWLDGLRKDRGLLPFPVK